MKKLLAPLILALALVACGGTPQDVPVSLETTNSGLHDGNGMWIGGPYHLTGTYSCGGTWTMKGDFDQAYSAPLGRYLSRVAQWTTIDSSRPESMLSGCVNANEGNQFYMARSGSYVLYNISPKTCVLYTHTTGQSSWTGSASVTINPADFQYVQPGGTRGTQDRFAVVVTAQTGVGNPGVCASMDPTFYFAAP